MSKTPSPAKTDHPKKDGSPLRFAMLGMIPGNGHPYSWSAIINGYDKAAMATCPYAGITRYLNAQPFESVRVPGAQVTHVWTDDPADAPLVSKASLVPNVVKRPEDVIGHVDAVFVATDDGFEHVRRARPFVEAGLPVFVDKPLALTVPDVRTFIAWKKGGARILSSSGMRYAPELDPILADRSALGDLRWISSLMAKAWENYGIHAFEPIFRILGPGFASVRLESQPKLEVAHILDRSGVQINIPMIYDGGAIFGTVHLVGAAGQLTTRLSGSDNTYYSAFRRQLVAFVDFVRAGGVDPYPFTDTVEMMAVLIAGLRSRAEGGLPVLSDSFKGAAVDGRMEIVGAARPQPAPLAPNFVGGLVHYRGDVLTTVSLRQLLGLPPKEGRQDLLVLECAGGIFGLLVDSVGEVLTVSSADHEPNPSILGERRRALFDGAYKLADGLLVMLNPEQLDPMRLSAAKAT